MHKDILKKIAGLVIFNNLKTDPTIVALGRYFRCLDAGDIITAASDYSDFVRNVLTSGGDFSEYLYKKVLFDDNIFMRKYFSGETGFLEPQLKYELAFLSDLSRSLPDDPVPGVYFPEIKASHIDFIEEFTKALPDSIKRGVGIFAKSAMFRVNCDGDFVPVLSEGTQHLCELIGYGRERQRIVENTVALMEGRSTSNVLLYGDAGTGKSSTVKAIAAEFAPDGLRLIELDRSQVSSIPNILEKIAEEPLKFIIFIDDLTLSPDSPELCTLKTVLEGGTGTDRSNCVIYVTSNHRHLVKENAADRSGEVNVQDNLQGILGLSARFGLAITFLAPDKELYLEIVRQLAEERSIVVTDQLLADAEAFAIRRNGRTPRCAKQYIELVSSGIDPIK